MALKILDSKITLNQVYKYTYQKYRNRFLYKKRDVLLKIDLKEIKVFDKVEKKIKTTYYKVEYMTFSYPQYSPYTKEKRGVKQRKYKHWYSGVIELQELSFDSKFRWRCGWDMMPKQAPKSQLKTVSIKDRQAIKTQVYNSVRGKKDKTWAKKEYSKRIKALQKRGKYLNNGDYNGRGLGEKSVMLDWWYRISYPLKKQGALYGKYHAKDGEIFPFFDKHTLRIIEYLLKKKILKYTRR